MQSKTIARTVDSFFDFRYQGDISEWDHKCRETLELSYLEPDEVRTLLYYFIRENKTYFETIHITLLGEREIKLLVLDLPKLLSHFTNLDEFILHMDSFPLYCVEELKSNFDALKDKLKIKRFHIYENNQRTLNLEKTTWVGFFYTFFSKFSQLSCFYFLR